VQISKLEPKISYNHW